MMIINWVDERGELRENRFTDSIKGLDFIASLRALDFSFTVVSRPEADR